MFKLSTRGDYGLVLMSTLAHFYDAGEHFVSLKAVAQERHLSLRYLSQIVISLKNAGLVKSKEGREGGYSLTRDPAAITMMEILEILEGQLAPVRCCEKASSKACKSESYCTVKTTWHEAQAMMAEFLKNKTLKDILPSNTDAHVSHN